MSRLRMCVALDDHGKRCRRLATVVEQVHLDNDLYGYGSPWAERGGATWIQAHLCAQHGPDYFRTKGDPMRRGSR